MQGAHLAAVFRQADRDPCAVRGWREPIDGHMALGFDFVGVEDDLFRAGIVGRRHNDQQALLFWRLELEGKQAAGPRDRIAIGRCHLREQGGQLREHVGPAFERIQMVARAAVLRVRPRPHGGIIAVLQPAVFIHHHDTMIFVAGGMIEVVGMRSGGWECE